MSIFCTCSMTGSETSNCKLLLSLALVSFQDPVWERDALHMRSNYMGGTKKKKLLLSEL